MESTQGNEIIIYQPDEELSLDVRVDDETVWLTQSQIVELFESSKANISEHLKHIFDSGELSKEATVRKFRTVRQEGNRNVTRNIDFFNLDVIISVGYRVNTVRGIQFRQWANKVLKEYLLRGYAVNQRLMQLEDRIDRHFSEYDRQISRQLRQDVEKHNAQYPGVTLHKYTKAHDRFLIIDEEVYHIGHSLKDLGKKLFAFSKMDVMTGSELISRL